jgi:hypothetical protein
MFICLYKLLYIYYIANALPLLRILINEAALKLALILLLLTTAGFLIFIFYFLIWNFIRSKKRERLRTYFGNIISEIAVCESISELQSFLQQTRRELLKLLQSSFFKKNFILELVKASGNMTGTSKENLKWLYEQLLLEKDSETRMQKNKWHIKAKAIQELAQMQQKKYIKSLYKLSDHPNAFVRMEAQTAVVKMFGFSGLRFLNVIRHTITDWQQFCLLRELTFTQISSFAGLEKWICSSNDSVVIFALRLVETYHCYELHDKVAEQLNHPAEAVQQRAIQTLGEIYQADTGALLIAAYNNAGKQLQFTVLRVLQKAATETDIPFLLQQLKHPDNQFKLMAARAIHHCSNNNTGIIKENIIKNGYSSAALLSKLLEEEII